MALPVLMARTVLRVIQAKMVNQVKQVLMATTELQVRQEPLVPLVLKVSQANRALMAKMVLQDHEERMLKFHVATDRMSLLTHYPQLQLIAQVLVCLEVPYLEALLAPLDIFPHSLLAIRKPQDPLYQQSGPQLAVELVHTVVLM